MSLINQVLNDLEKRGASTRIGEATIRVVPSRRSYAVYWLLFILLSVLILAATIWVTWRHDTPPNMPATMVLAVPLPALAASSVQTAPSSPIVAAPAGVLTLPAEIAAVSPRMPIITAITPNPAAAISRPQALMITGEHFAEEVSVNLYSPAGKVYANRPLLLHSATQIMLNPNFGHENGLWRVEIVNKSGHLLTHASLMVQPAPATVSPPLTGNGAHPPKAQSAPPLPIVAEGSISKQPTQITPQQQAENTYRKAYELMQQGHFNAAISGCEAALKLDANHLAARQTLVRLLLDSKRVSEAEQVLQAGLQHDPKQSALAMLLARIQVGRNELPQALETMQKTLPFALQQADYQAFIAALLQRLNRHQEAIVYFQNALQLTPQSGVWLMGLGISLHAENRNAEARSAFTRALEVHNLNDELQQFVRQQLKEL
jgi:MSHA biogenesis protein MshN